MSHSVIRLIGAVITRNSRPTLAFASPSNSATMIAGIIPLPANSTQGSAYAPTPTAIAVTITLIRNPMRVIVRDKVKLLYSRIVVLQGDNA